MKITRRAALKTASALLGTTTFGCGSAEPDDAADATEGAIGGAPASLAEYENIVVVMMENRSFDHYFGHLSLPKSMGGEGRTDVDGLRGDEFQLDLDGARIAPFHAADTALTDLPHEWDPCHDQFNGGKMDGFVRSYHQDLVCAGDAVCRAKKNPMAYYNRGDTPVFHALADEYVLCDRWFASVMGPTWPNRLFLHAATSGGMKTNKAVTSLTTIWQAANEKRISAINYFQDVPWALGGLRRVVGQLDVFDKPSVSGKQDTFETACREGKLPAISIVDPGFVFVKNDDHPPHDIVAGQAFVAAIYNMLAANELQWNRTLLIVIYDEHGGFYDHVAPPSVAEDERPEFRQLGFRVPALMIGPYVQRGAVVHTQFDHVSIASTVTRRFGLRPLNARVTAANDLRTCMRPDPRRSNARAPAVLPRLSMRESEVLAALDSPAGHPELAQLHPRGSDASLARARTMHYLEALDRLGVARIQ